MPDTTGSGLTAVERQEIRDANDSGRVPVVFVHGLWLLSSSWDRWRAYFDRAGYATIAPGWPDDPLSVTEARADPDVFANKMVQQVTDHYLEAISGLDRSPAVIGHSFGGLIAQKIAAAGVSRATVAIDNAPFKGVLPVPLSSLKAASSVFSHPTTAHRAVSLTFEQFRYGWANNLDEQEANELYETFHVPAPGAPLFQAALANFTPFGGETALDPKAPGRGPLLIVAGDSDNTVPLAITRASYKLQSENVDVTEIVELPGRGHSLTIDHGWEGVAEPALHFVERFG